MEVGMLWFDDGPRSFGEKIQRAVSFYDEKYGQAPTLCLVHPSMLETEEGVIAGVRIQQAKQVMPDHFLVGVEEENSENGAKSARRAA